MKLDKLRTQLRRIPAKRLLFGTALGGGLLILVLGVVWSMVGLHRPSLSPEAFTRESSSAGQAPNASGLSVNTLDRSAVAAFYREHYLGSPDVDAQWTGQHVLCDEGSTSLTFRDAILHRVRYFRAMAGVPADVEFSDDLNAQAQEAALLMSANGKLSHTPDPSWYCYSATGAWAAEHCNLYLEVYSVSAVDGYMEDPGDRNYYLPHRRWLLNVRTHWMGTGDVPPVAGFPAANALWVTAPSTGNRPATRDPYVAWPPPGCVPYQVVFPRWSVSYDGADFSQASVIMIRHGQRVALQVLPVVDGSGENTLVWEPHIPTQERPVVDTWYTVQVRNMLVKGFSHSFQYTVVIFDPDS